jgi:multidrug resistance efflux pump
MSILKTLRSAVFEEDEEATRAPATGAAAPGGAPAATGHVPSGPEHALAPGADDDVYRALLEKTSFEVTGAGRAVARYLGAMDALPLDGSVKLRTAIAQARRLDGLTDDALLASFGAMKGALEAEQRSFHEASARFKAGEIDDREGRMRALTTEIDDRQAQLARLTAELAQARASMARTTARFTTAADRREGEIAQEQARLAAVLGG